MLIFANVNLWPPKSHGTAAFSKIERFCYGPETAAAAMRWSIDWSNMALSTGT